MELAGSLLLGGRSALALGRIAVDGMAERLWRALPRTPEQFAQPQALNALIRDHAPPGAPPLPDVTGARLPGVHFESSNCTNFVVELEFGPEVAGSPEPLPATAYVKLPCDALATRTFANAIGFWALECTFCERLAAKLPVRVPRVYAVARRGSRFALVLENLHDSPGTRLFTNRDMAAGTTPARARLCLSAFAELHAAFGGWSEAQREAVLPLRLHSFASPRRHAMTRALNAHSIGPCHAKAPDVFSEEAAALCRLAIANWEALNRVWYSGPLTLIHGDSHLGNLFEYPTPDGPQMGMLDFQAVQWSKGIRDAQYFLTNSLEPEVLAAHEDELLDHYLAELDRYGVRLDAAEAREQYRAFSFQTLMTAVVAYGLGPLTEREAVVRTVLRRSVAAIRRLAFGDWLRALA